MNEDKAREYALNTLKNLYDELEFWKFRLNQPQVFPLKSKLKHMLDEIKAYVAQIKAYVAQLESCLSSLPDED